MHQSHNFLASLFIIALIIFASSYIGGRRSHAYAQQESTIASSQREQGITLYKQGNFKGAINQLRAVVKQDRDDADAWRYLGLALNNGGDLKDARKALKKPLNFVRLMLFRIQAWPTRYSSPIRRVTPPESLSAPSRSTRTLPT